MPQQKKLIINCDVCDARKVKVDELSHYESITVNTNVMLIDERSKAVLNSLPIDCNAVEFLEIEGDVDVIAINGNYELSKNTNIEKNSLLVVNGNLTVQPSAAEIIGSFAKVFVNGSLQYPKSMDSIMRNLKLNGCSECIPDDCKVLRNPNFTVNRYFPIMAERGRVYYAHDSVILWDASVDIDMMLNKNVRFLTRKFICNEQLLQKAVVMFDENTELIEIPTGCEFIEGDVALYPELVEQSGGRMFVNGNLTLDQGSTSVIERIEKLVVNGEVCLSENQLDKFKKISAEYRSISVIKGQRIKDRLQVKIDRRMLDSFRDSFSIANCVCVSIGEDILPEEILSRLEIVDCACVKCTSHQRSAVEAVSKNTAQIDTGEVEAADKVNLKDARVINSGTYIL